MSEDIKTPGADIAIVGDAIQIHPSSLGDQQVSSEQSLLVPYARFRNEPFSALQELSQHVIGTSWRSYETPIGQEIFYSGFSERMKNLVMAQRKLQQKITDLANRRVEVEIHEGRLGPKGVEGETNENRDRRLTRKREIEAQLTEVAEGWTENMICKMESRYFIRGAYYLATQLLTRAYHQGIHVSSDEVLQLRTVAAEAAKKKQSIVFLPCHRSHVDYVSLQLICYRLGLALPTVVAGDNLNFPGVGYFINHAGAMWIRRSFGNDQLYSTLVQAYMNTLLQNGYNIECFVEGGRSRTGKLLPPKFGILSFVLESILSGEVNDAIICPVSTQYDKVIEVNSYISELLGQPKQKEGLSGFLGASNVLSLKLGRVDVRFHEPWSLKDFVMDQQTRLSAQVSTPPPSESAIRRVVLSRLGYRVLSDINTVSVVMPTALVGTVLLTLRGRGVGKSELTRRVEWLTARVRARGGRVAHLEQSTTQAVIDRALAVLGPEMVGTVPDLPEETYFAVDRFQLSFYRNMTIHLFISQALVCAALYTTVKAGGIPEEQRMSYADLSGYVGFLSSLFRAEFIFDAGGLEQNIRSTLAGLEDDKVLTTSVNNDGVVFVGLHPRERASGREDFDFYNFLLWPFIEGSWLGTVALFMLVPPADAAFTHADQRWVDWRHVQDQAQLLGKTLYHQGDLSYFEAVNKEVLKNSFARSEEEGIIVVSKPARDAPAGTPTRVRLASDWLPTRYPNDGALVPEGKLWDLTERIGESRREGKNRRDGMTVRRRVLGLADLVARQIWDAAVAGGPTMLAAPVVAEAKSRHARQKKTRSRALL